MLPVLYVPTFIMIFLSNYLILEFMKNMTELSGNWNTIKGKLKQKYAQLTDDDLMFLEGKQDELYGRLEAKLGKSREEIRKVIAEM